MAPRNSQVALETSKKTKFRSTDAVSEIKIRGLFLTTVKNEVQLFCREGSSRFACSTCSAHLFYPFTQLPRSFQPFALFPRPGTGHVMKLATALSELPPSLRPGLKCTLPRYNQGEKHVTPGAYNSFCSYSYGDTAAGSCFYFQAYTYSGHNPSSLSTFFPSSSVVCSTLEETQNSVSVQRKEKDYRIPETDVSRLQSTRFPLFLRISCEL